MNAVADMRIEKIEVSFEANSRRNISQIKQCLSHYDRIKIQEQAVTTESNGLIVNHHAQFLIDTL
jgi:hypothetical protein